jgi:hypothetical protein
MSRRRRASLEEIALVQRASIAAIEHPEEYLEETGRHFSAAISTGRGRGLIVAALVVAVVLALGEVDWGIVLALLLLAGGHFLAAAAIRRRWDEKALDALERRWPR